MSSERFLQEILAVAREPPGGDEDPEAPAHFQEPCASLYQRYTDWCRVNGERHTQSNTRFGVTAKALGFQKTYPRTAGGGRVHQYVHMAVH